MKNISRFALFLFVFLAVFAIFSSVSKAENAVYKLDEVTEGYVVLHEKEVLEFPWEGKTHRFMIREISKDKQSIAVTLFIEGAETPVYTLLSRENYARFDFNLDKEPELAIQLYDVYNGEVTLYLKPLLDTSGESKITAKGIAIAVAVILIGVLLYILLRKKKK